MLGILQLGNWTLPQLPTVTTGSMIVMTIDFVLFFLLGVVSVYIILASLKAFIGLVALVVLLYLVGYFTSISVLGPSIVSISTVSSVFTWLLGGFKAIYQMIQVAGWLNVVAFILGAVVKLLLGGD